MFLMINMFMFFFSQNLLPLCLYSQRIVFFEQSILWNELEGSLEQTPSITWRHLDLSFTNSIIIQLIPQPMLKYFTHIALVKCCIFHSLFFAICRLNDWPCNTVNNISESIHNLNVIISFKNMISDRDKWRNNSN